MSRAEPAARGVSDAAPVFAALGDPTRLALLSRLSDGRPRSISRLTEGFDVSRQGLTKHLRVMEQAGIVQSRKVGRESRYQIAPGPLDEARLYLDRIAAQWDDALSRLKAFVEE